MEKTVITMSDAERAVTDARDDPAGHCALPDAPMPMPQQNLSPPDAPWLRMFRAVLPQRAVRS